MLERVAGSYTSLLRECVVRLARQVSHHILLLASARCFLRGFSVLPDNKNLARGRARNATNPVLQIPRRKRWHFYRRKAWKPLFFGLAPALLEHLAFPVAPKQCNLPSIWVPQPYAKIDVGFSILRLFLAAPSPFPQRAEPTKPRARARQQASAQSQ